MGTRALAKQFAVSYQWQSVLLGLVLALGVLLAMFPVIYLVARALGWTRPVRVPSARDAIDRAVREPAPPYSTQRGAERRPVGPWGG